MTYTPCHGPRTRATQLDISLFWRADARLLDGPVRPGHDTLRIEAAE